MKNFELTQQILNNYISKSLFFANPERKTLEYWIDILRFSIFLSSNIDNFLAVLKEKLVYW